MTGSISIENDAVLVTVVPHYGARVVNLICKATGRDWLAGGDYSDQNGDEAVYGAGEAAGWDECFPTVAPYDASGTTWGRTLRDHGDLWGRPWVLDALTQTSLETRYEDDQFVFARQLSLSGACLTARYRVANKARDVLPYLWALHALLAVTPADRLEIPGLENLHATYLVVKGNKSETGVSFAWPGPNARWPFRLDTVMPLSARSAVKLYASGLAGGRAVVGNGRERLAISWDRTMPGLGLWLNYGGWPQPGMAHHIAIEPTSAPFDHLGEVLDAGTPNTLLPGRTSSWRVDFTLGPHEG